MSGRVAVNNGPRSNSDTIGTYIESYIKSLQRLKTERLIAEEKVKTAYFKKKPMKELATLIKEIDYINIQLKGYLKDYIDLKHSEEDPEFTRLNSSNEEDLNTVMKMIDDRQAPYKKPIGPADFPSIAVQIANAERRREEVARSMNKAAWLRKPRQPWFWGGSRKKSRKSSQAKKKTLHKRSKL